MRRESNKFQVEQLAANLEDGARMALHDAMAVSRALSYRVDQREQTYQIYAANALERAVQWVRRYRNSVYVDTDLQRQERTVKMLRLLRDDLNRTLDYMDGKTPPAPTPTMTGPE